MSIFRILQATAIKNETGTVEVPSSNSDSVDQSEISYVRGVTSSIQDQLNTITAQKAAANGLASLDASGKVPSAQIPAVAITDTYVVGSQVAMLALAAATGDVAVRTDLTKSFILQGTNPTVLSDWQELLTPPDAVISVNGTTGAVSLSTSNITEGTNLYYTSSRFNSAFSGKTTADLSEGSNQYFTDARARSSQSATTPLSYNSSTGVHSIQSASTSQAGALSATDWNTFNNKISAIGYSASTPSRALNTNFTPNATKAVMGVYTIRIAVSLLQSGTVELRSDTNATPTTVRAAVNSSASQDMVLMYLVPPNHNVRLVSSGTATISIVQQSEVSIDIS